MKYFFKKPLLSVGFAIILLLGGGCGYLTIDRVITLTYSATIPPETTPLDDINQSFYQRDVNKDEPVYFELIYQTSKEVKDLREFVGTLGGEFGGFNDFMINGQTIATFAGYNHSPTTLSSIYQKNVFEQANGIALSEATAEDLGVTLGDEITITADYQAWNDTELQVVVEHILKPNFDSLNPEYQDIYDKYFVYFPFMIISDGIADELRERSEAITSPNKDKGAYTSNKTTYSSMSLYFDDYETAEKALNEFMAKIDEEALNRN